MRIPKSEFRLTDGYDERFYEMLVSFQERLRRHGREYSGNVYTFLYPSFGEKFMDDRKILVCSESTEAFWQPLFCMENDVEMDLVEKSRSLSGFRKPDADGSMDKSVGSNRTIIWNLSREVTNRVIGIDEGNNEDEWTRQIAFNSLLKIRNIEGGYPDQQEYDAQKDFAVELFLRELNETKPEIVLLLDGLDYSDDFIAALGLEPNVEGMDYVVVAAKVHDTKVILTRSVVGGVDKCADEIKEMINRM
jgi:hypothetical protein